MQEKLPDYLQKQQDLAAGNADLLKELAVMGNEVAFSAWMRTGIIAVASGLGFMRFWQPMERADLARLVGGSFIVIGAAIYLIAFWRYRKMVRSGLGLERWRMVPLRILAALVVFLLLNTLLALFLLSRL